jgi:hypothetical protein
VTVFVSGVGSTQSGTPHVKLTPLDEHQRIASAQANVDSSVSELPQVTAQVSQLQLAQVTLGMANPDNFDWNQPGDAIKPAAPSSAMDFYV